MIEIPRFALSVMNPWAWLIVNGLKDIENRTWRTSNPGLRFRGEVAIHAGKMIDIDASCDVSVGRHPVTGEPFAFKVDDQPRFADLEAGFLNGGIVGVAEIVDCVTSSDSDWFVGEYGFVIRNARPVDFIESTGALGFFDWREVERKAAEKRALKAAA